jgi:hypothetical protein
MKQTAVEWFKDVIESFGNKHELQMSWDTFNEVFEQAKEMEKEQIKSAFTKGDLFAEDYFYPEKPNVDCSENYYNETFNNESKNKN